MKPLEHLHKPVNIVDLTKNESVRSIVDQIGHTSTPGSNDGQAARHGFGDGQAEGIFATWADVEVGRGIEIENLCARRLKTAALGNTERFCQFAEGFRRIVSGRDD